MRLPTVGVVEKLLEAVACVAPDGLVGICLDEAGEDCKTFRMEHRVSSGEGYVHVGIDDEAEQCFYRHGGTALVVP